MKRAELLRKTLFDILVLLGLFLLLVLLVLFSFFCFCFVWYLYIYIYMCVYIVFFLVFFLLNRRFFCFFPSGFYSFGPTEGPLGNQVLPFRVSLGLQVFLWI